MVPGFSGNESFRPRSPDRLKKASIPAVRMGSRPISCKTEATLSHFVVSPLMGRSMALDPVCRHMIKSVLGKKVDNFLPEIFLDVGAFTGYEKFNQEGFKTFGKDAAEHLES